LPSWGVDRCADARDDIVRAKGMNVNTQGAQARNLLMSGFVACPANPQNLELLGEAYDLLGDLALAGKYREQAMRLRGDSSKPVVKFSASSSSIESGQTTRLTWNVAYVREVEINPDLGRVPATGSKAVAPASTTAYQLTAKGPGGSTTASVEITVTVPRLTEDQIVDLLQGEVSQSRIAQFATERGVTFEVTPASEERLRGAGADNPLIEALKKAKR